MSQYHRWSGATQAVLQVDDNETADCAENSMKGLKAPGRTFNMRGMKKRPNPALTPTAFSIASQFTGPPFSVTLESAELRRHLLEEMTRPAAKKSPKTPAKRPVKKARKKS